MAAEKCTGREGYISCVQENTIAYTDKYEYMMFLKKYFLECNPEFFGVVHASVVDSALGQLDILHITEEVCDPANGIVACCEVNRRNMYLYNDRYFTNVILQCHMCTDEIYRTLIRSNSRIEPFEPVLVLLEIKPPNPEDIIV